MLIKNETVAPIRESAEAVIKDLKGTENYSWRRLLTAMHPCTLFQWWHQWFEERESFWCLAMGRSGTRFLANLLNKCEAATVQHEPRYEDLDAYRRAYYSCEEASYYLRAYALPIIYLSNKKDDPHVYGEVNSYLRRHAEALGAVVPGTKLWQLVRDGRDVIRSLYARKTLTAEDKATSHLRKLGESGTEIETYGVNSRFVGLCRYWRNANRYLRENTSHFVRFEDLLTNYDYFRAEMLDPLRLSLSRKKWNNMRDNQVNKTTEHELKRPEQWEDSLVRCFWDICGDEMRRYGYVE